MMMKRIATSFLLSLFQVVMIFTLTLAPVPFMDRVNAVYADDDSEEVRDDCEDDENEDGSPRVYKPGCDFNDALTKAGDQSTTPGLVGVIEQFIAAGFGLAAINSLAFTQHPMAKIDCPGYMTPDITLRLMQAGSLAYIVGNIQSNQKFKSAAKEAVDIELTPQAKRDETVNDEEQAIKNREFNQKQLDAYMALIKVYEAKVKALESKKNMAMLAEVAYLGALGTELTFMATHHGTCSAAETLDQTQHAAITTAVETVQAAIATDATTIYSCGTATAFAVTKLSDTELSEATRASTAAALMTDEIERSSRDQGFISKMFSSFVQIFTLGVAGFFLGVTDPSDELREAQTQQEAATADTTLSTSLTGATGTTGVVATNCAECPTCSAAVENLGNLEATRAATLNSCCGTRIHSVPTGYAPVPLAPGKIHLVDDVIISPVFVGGVSNDHAKRIASGFMIEYFLNQMASPNYSQREKIEYLKKGFGQIEYFEQNFEQIIESDHYKRELASLTKELNGVEVFDHSQNINLNKVVDTIKQSFIQDAHAGGFGELMGLGIKMLALNYALGDFMRKKALVNPQNRMWTFGAMAAVNLGLMIFNGKSAKEAKNRLEIVKDEARAFAESHALKADFDEKLAELDLASKSGLSAEELAKLNALGQRPDVVTCADPKGNSFVPAQCPSKLRPSNLNLALDSDSKRRLGNSPLGQALPLISDAAAGVANGSTLSDNSGGTARGSIAQLGKVRNALKEQVDGLADDYDKNVLSKQLNKDQFKRASLAGNNAKFRSLFNGDPAKNGVTKDMLAGVSGGLAEIEKLKDNKENKTASKVSTFTPPQFVVPKTNDFNFDIGGSNNTGANMAAGNGSGNSLDDFQVNAGDVNQKADVSIFRIISNRYLKSYPVLLEEKK